MPTLKRVAIISYHTCPLVTPGQGNAGGMNVYIRRLAQEFGAMGVTADVFTREHEGTHQHIEGLGSNARVIHLPAGPRETPKEGLHEFVPDFVNESLKFAQRHRLHYDALHAHYWLSGVVGLKLRDEWKAPLIATFHTLAEAKRHARVGEFESDVRIESERVIASSADMLLVSTANEQQILAQLYDVPSEKVAVLPPGVDTDLFRLIAKPAAYDGAGLDHRRMVLFVGRLDPLKGVDIILHAMALLENAQAVDLVVVGGEQEGKNETSRLKSVAHVLGIGDRVHFVGIVPHEELPYYYSAAEALVMPSYYESFGLAALEAMACGTPVVAARVGGLPSVVKDGETGFLVPWHCAEPFSQRIEVLLTNPDLRDSMGRAARLHASARGWRTVAQETLLLYTEVMQSYHQAPIHG